ncbi:hypothetical protein [Catellatospora sp. TT07R-123]|uniref:hypothetical protein n=1 Tax=Catellatospora sp. TT07R-123 TaxID=2733863 RepID=UPI001BB3E2CB|nr:hypothetical protein [Catellatospora sp. TT07R-123]
MAWQMLIVANDGVDEEASSRTYRDEAVCLLTDQDGILKEPAKQVWLGLSDGSLQTLVKVQYLAVTGAQTADNGRTFVAGLAQSDCEMIIAVGDVPVQAVRESASRFTGQRFVLVGVDDGAGLETLQASRMAACDLITDVFG